jgi:coiled-coil domain-containing protein 12
MSEDRKARLAALAARAGRKRNEENPAPAEGNDKDVAMDGDGANDEEEAQKKTVNFRNYAPQDESLEKNKEEPPSKRPRKEEQKDEKKVEEKSELEKALKDAKADAAVATREASKAVGQNDIAAVVPKKVNWDLKRDITKKMNRLERRTQKAVVELLRQRLEQEAEEGGDDLD